MSPTEKIAVIGLGYVGLPLCLALAEKFGNVIGFDINAVRVKELKNGVDVTQEADPAVLKKTAAQFTTSLKDLKDCTFFIITVPTPVDGNKNPDLTPVKKASEAVGNILKKGSVVVLESTVYPGVTEEICGPIIAKTSGLKQGQDFKLGYSPERINPGDKVHTLANIVKVVSGQDDETLARVAKVYESIITAGIHKAPSIKVAEAAKVIENTQRDLNISLMNELAIIFDKLDLRTKDVLAAAGSKWNFLNFTPGLVGGHCIGVDPYYLTTKAQEIGYNPEVILAGRRINDGMGAFIAQKTIKLLGQAGHKATKAKVAILGLSFKENVPDLRNSRVPDILEEFKEYGMEVLIHDPLADRKEAKEEYNITLCKDQDLKDMAALIFAVPHQTYLDKGPTYLKKFLKPEAVVIDVKSALNPDDFQKYQYWSL